MTVCFLGVLLVGCQNVWVHPEATEQKYEADLYQYRYGVAKPTAEDILSGNVEPIPTRVRKDWKQCMETIGWSVQNRVAGGSHFRKP